MPNNTTKVGIYYTVGEGKQSRLTQNDINNVCATYLEGNSIEATALLCGISRTLTARILKEQRVKMRKRGRTEKSILDRWIDRQIMVTGPTIMQRRAAGASCKELAEIYEVGYNHMRKHVVKLTSQLEERRNTKLCQQLDRFREDAA